MISRFVCYLKIPILISGLGEQIVNIDNLVHQYTINLRNSRTKNPPSETLTQITQISQIFEYQDS